MKDYEPCDPAADWRPLWAIGERLRQQQRNVRRGKIFCGIACTLLVAAFAAIIWQALQ